jgi:hypothetical protein
VIAFLICLPAHPGAKTTTKIAVDILAEAGDKMSKAKGFNKVIPTMHALSTTKNTAYAHLKHLILIR